VSDDELIETLNSGTLHSFANFNEIAELPRTGAGVYTIWEFACERPYPVSSRVPHRSVGLTSFEVDS
jgi:hypothetical protein